MRIIILMKSNTFIFSGFLQKKFTVHYARGLRKIVDGAFCRKKLHRVCKHLFRIKSPHTKHMHCWKFSAHLNRRTANGKVKCGWTVQSGGTNHVEARRAVDNLYDVENWVFLVEWGKFLLWFLSPKSSNPIFCAWFRASVPLMQCG